MRSVITKISIILLFINYSCNPLGDHPVPNVAVSVQINILLPSYSALMSIGGYTYVNGGVKGIVVYRKSNDEFMAYDRMSTAAGGFDCDPLEIDTDNFIFMTDTCSNAVYSLIDGSVVSGDAVYGLRAYQTYWNAQNNTLTIYN